MQTNLALKTAPQPCAAHFANAASYTVHKLKPLNSLVSQFMQLHQHVLMHLPKNGKHWVKRRHFSSIKQHIEQGHIALGVFDASNKMVGQMLITFPDKLGGQNLKGYPIGTGQLAPEQCAILQTLGLSKDHRGADILPMLFTEAERITSALGRTQLIAKTDILNTRSINGFTKAGYVSGPETYVEGEPYQCVFMQKTIHPSVKL